MTNIEYVVVSDFHLGAENSLLTNLVKDSYQTDNSKPSPVMEHLVKCLRDVFAKNPQVKKPKLVLNGDLMELAFTTENQAGMAFQRFVELTMPENEADWMFDPEFVIIPGNHDHNLWETARYGNFIEELEKMKPHEFIKPSIHITKMFNPVKINCQFLTGLLRMYPHLRAKGAMVTTAYPALAQLNNATDKCLIISHGHFIESMYSFISILDKMIFPERVEPTILSDLEQENFAWIDFFWSTLGRSGTPGNDLSLMYDKMQNPEEVSKMIENFCTSVANHEKNFILRYLEKNILEEVVQFLIEKAIALEKNQNGVLTPDTQLGLKKYLEVFIKNQLDFELNGAIPTKVSFLFGHTHKPFEQDIEFSEYEGMVKVFNSGGWVVDTLEPMPFHGGSVLLVDESLDTVALQMYKEGKYKPSLEVSGFNQHMDYNALYDWLNKALDFDAEPWTEFGRVTEKEVKLRYKYLAELMQKN
ncbi:MAG: metallophosphoesterase [Bacteroidia bacterium]|nr:metallophosphoesterase [Bacteroidia bacterium]